MRLRAHTYVYLPRSRDQFVQTIPVAFKIVFPNLITTSILATA